MAHQRAAPFISNEPQKSRMFCVSYASSQHQLQQSSANTNTNPSTIHEHQEEIYSSLKKVRTSDENQLTIDRHVTMIPLGSPHELHREPNGQNGTMIRVTTGLPQKVEVGMKELVPKMRAEPRKVVLQEPEAKKDFEGWSGRVMEGRVSGRATNNIRGYWERNIQIENRQRAEEERRQRPKSYGFPKWRSTDALSASLVASNSIQIPVDSRIPEERLRKMEETEREAIEVKKEIHEEADTQHLKLSKGKSLDCLNMQVDHRPWYDTEKIKSAVSRESIANIATSREFFETASQRDWRSGANSQRDSMCSLSIAPPLPPKSDAVQMRQRYSGGGGQNVNVLNVGGYQEHPQGVQNAHHQGLLSQNSYHQNQNHQIHQNHQIQNTQNFGAHHQNTQKPPQPAPQTSINRLIQQDSPQTADPIEQQEVLLMLYLKQNLDIVQGLGIHIPSELLAEMDDLQSLPVELRICDEEPHRMFSPVNKNGRYQRKPVNPSANLGRISQPKYVANNLNNSKTSLRSRQNSEMSEMSYQQNHFGYQ